MRMTFVLKLTFDFSFICAADMSSSKVKEEPTGPIYQCKFCDFTSMQKDRVARHESQTCNKEKVICECGGSVAKSGLARHKKTNLHSTKMEAKMSATVNGPVGDLEIRKVVSNIRIITQEDGKKLIQPEPVTIEGISMVLTPVSAIESSTEALTPAPSPNELVQCDDFEGIFSINLMIFSALFIS